MWRWLSVPVITKEGRAGGAPLVGFTLRGKDHFDVIAPVLTSFAQKIAADNGSGDFAWDPR